MKKEDIIKDSTKLITYLWGGIAELDILTPPAEVTSYSATFVTVDGTKFERGIDYRWHLANNSIPSPKLNSGVPPRAVKVNVIMVNLRCERKHNGKDVHIPFYLSSISKNTNTVNVYTALQQNYYYNTNDITDYSNSSVFNETNKILYFKNLHETSMVVNVIEYYLLNANEILYL